jgi:NH3-dependent NAD+ synthetase
LADPHNPENVAHIKEGLAKTLSPEMQKKIVVYHLRGGIDYARLGLIHKSMMAMLHSVLAKKDSSALSQEDKQMLDTYGKAVDFTDKAAIKPIVEFVRA